MNIVTLAHIKLKFSTYGGLGKARQCTAIAEVADEEIETLRQLVIKIAEANGGFPKALQNLQQERNFGPNTVTFTVQDRNSACDPVHAECLVFPALKAGGRYFGLEEVAVQDAGRHGSVSDCLAAQAIAAR